MKRLHVISSLPVLLVLCGCSEEPKQPASEAKPAETAAEPVSAQSAVHQMWIKARAWATDAGPLRVVNMNLKQVKNEGGKAGGWDAEFVSPTARKSRRFTYSVVEVPPASLHKGVFAGAEDTFSAGGQNQPFPIQALKVDSTAAYETALKKGGDEFAKTHPDVPVNYVLEKTKRFVNPTWRVFWGESVSTSGFSVFVDATTGEFLQKTR